LLFQKEKLVSKSHASKLLAVFHQVATELQTSYIQETTVQRFRFSSLGKGRSFSRVADTFSYLVNAGLILQSEILREPVLPIVSNLAEKNLFKCFFFDVGILNAKLDVSYQNLLDDELSLHKGPIAENFVAQNLAVEIEDTLRSWKTKNYEIEFLLQGEKELYPVEVKASSRSSKSPSLTRYIDRFEPEKAYKLAPRNFGDNGKYLSLPIYLVEKLRDPYSQP
jgi:predicted AAA+ superfamily ATPase